MSRTSPSGLENAEAEMRASSAGDRQHAYVAGAHPVPQPHNAVHEEPAVVLSGSMVDEAELVDAPFTKKADSARRQRISPAAGAPPPRSITPALGLSLEPLGEHGRSMPRRSFSPAAGMPAVVPSRVEPRSPMPMQTAAPVVAEATHAAELPPQTQEVATEPLPLPVFPREQLTAAARAPEGSPNSASHSAPHSAPASRGTGWKVAFFLTLLALAGVTYLYIMRPLDAQPGSVRSFLEQFGK